MRVLVVKLSSMGDVIHSLPALTDAEKKIPGIKFDWVVEENFVEIAQWHPAVENVIPINLRSWRGNKWHAIRTGEILKFLKQLRLKEYDLIIDAQGLLKSAVVSLLAKGKRAGLDKYSARGKYISWLYHQPFYVFPEQHAVERVRQLFSKALHYDHTDLSVDYGLSSLCTKKSSNNNYLVFLHSTTWDSKLWPEKYWVQLVKKVIEKGYKVKLPSGNAVEKERADRIGQKIEGVEIFPRLSIKKIAELLFNAQAVVSVDTGFGHLAAALNIPTVSIYGATNPRLTATYGDYQKHLIADYACAPCMKRSCSQLVHSEDNTPPCYSTINASKVWDALQSLLEESG